ncbi:hypothetical protein BDA99DRAFT_536271 [Phascolomyces articulosus]|uniref:Uncharacterized protein n=1 Tax=Phascolomyces articulosus TaxID=60185 RepID=A0AAD5KCH4_9FUNG|nr:hypothetical protein BDA99DRAFT_536271 [Phascolomyces articulosus]
MHMVKFIINSTILMMIDYFLKNIWLRERYDNQVPGMVLFDLIYRLNVSEIEALSILLLIYQSWILAELGKQRKTTKFCIRIITTVSYQLGIKRKQGLISMFFKQKVRKKLYCIENSKIKFMRSGENACCPYNNRDCSNTDDKSYPVKFQVSFFNTGEGNVLYNISGLAGGYVIVSGTASKPKFAVFTADHQSIPSAITKLTMSCYKTRVVYKNKLHTEFSNTNFPCLSV